MKEQSFEELTQKVDYYIEQLALRTSEFESLKSESQEQLERLNMKLQGNFFN
jgi:hypothetical protein